jgi:hypothetical protein
MRKSSARSVRGTGIGLYRIERQIACLILRVKMVVRYFLYVPLVLKRDMVCSARRGKRGVGADWR